MEIHWLLWISIKGTEWRTWRLLERLTVGCDLLWLCAGDYNEILNDQENRGVRSEGKDDLGIA